MDTLYTFWNNITHDKTESVEFLGLMNLATKVSETPLRCLGPRVSEFRVRGLGFRV